MMTVMIPDSWFLVPGMRLRLFGDVCQCGFEGLTFESPGNPVAGEFEGIHTVHGETVESTGGQGRER